MNLEDKKTMELYKSNHSENNYDGKQIFEPIRGSIAVLAIRLLLILLLFDILYTLIYYLSTLEISLPFDLHHHIAVALFIMQILKTLLQMSMLLQVILSWANNLYFLTDQHIIKRSGVFNVTEELFHYQNIRSIAIHQTFIGKLCNYGDILLKTSASGGYQDDVALTGIDNPKKYEQELQKLF